MAAGFAKALIHTRVKQYETNPFFGKPYVKIGMSMAFSMNLFEIGGVLSVKYSTHLDEFGLSFLGMKTTTSKTVAKNLLEMGMSISDDISPHQHIVDYVTQNYVERLDWKDDPSLFLLKNGGKRLKPDTAKEVAFQFAVFGTAFGSACPEAFRQIYDNTYMTVSADEWNEARKHGLDIPPKPELISFSEREEDENGLFMRYCEEMFPSAFQVLK